MLVRRQPRNQLVDMDFGTGVHIIRRHIAAAATTRTPAREAAGAARSVLSTVMALPAVIQQIKVKNAGGVPNGSHATETRFDLMQRR